MADTKMQVTAPGLYRLTADLGVRNLTTVATLPAGTVIEITQVDRGGHKVYGPMLLDWTYWTLPVEPVAAPSPSAAGAPKPRPPSEPTRDPDERVKRGFRLGIEAAARLVESQGDQAACDHAADIRALAARPSSEPGESARDECLWHVDCDAADRAHKPGFPVAHHQRRPAPVRCAPGCKGIDLGDGNHSGCACPDGRLANGRQQPPGFVCDCPQHPGAAAPSADARDAVVAAALEIERVAENSAAPFKLLYATEQLVAEDKDITVKAALLAPLFEALAALRAAPSPTTEKEGR